MNTVVCLCGGEFSTQVLLVKHASAHGHMLRCSCQRLFGSHQQLRDHEQDKHPQRIGVFEVLELVSNPSSSAPPATAHTCTICNSTLANGNGLPMHIQAKHPSCPTCSQSFRNASQLEGHQRMTEHCYCTEHSAAFASVERLRKHLRKSVHVSAFECTVCDRAFKSSRALDDHLSSDGHANVEHAVQARANAAARAESSRAQRPLVTPQEEKHIRCDDCSRTFTRITALYQHKKSVKHNPLSDLRCPVSDKCTQVFTTPSALLFHLESGKCSSGMNRALVNMAVHDHDTERNITSSSNLLGVIAAAATTERLGSAADLASRLSGLSLAEGSSAFGKVEDISDADSTTSNNDDGVPIFTPTNSICSRSRSISFVGDATPRPQGRLSHERIFVESCIGGPRVPPAVNDFTAPPAILHDSSDVSTEIQELRCPAPGCKRSFRQQHSLIEHLESPAHAPDLYHCPTGLALPASRRPARSFKTVSGILQHLEAGACVGGTEVLDRIFAMVEAKVTEVTGTNVRLLKNGGR